MKFLKTITVAFTLIIISLGANATSHSEFRGLNFPLRVANNQFFEDAAGKPVSLFGEAAWSLIAAMKREEVTLYLNDRKKRGFNALLVNLLEKMFSVDPPANIYGEKPFLNKPFGELNPAYFDHAEWVVKQAQHAGMLVFLTPAYLGVSGSNQGWYAEELDAGPTAMRKYGEAVATRFARYPNIIWVMGGDFDPPELELISSMAEGIKSVLPDAIIAVHGNRNSAPTDVWPDARWLSIDTVYDYDTVYLTTLTRTEYQKLPVILLETLYEGERDTNAQTIRKNAYGALLAGAAGQFFGNSPVWHFNGSGVFGNDRAWQESLNTEGAQSITHLRQLYDLIQWNTLLPDRTSDIVAREDLFAARTSDQEFSLIYGTYDGDNNFIIRRTALSPEYRAIWFDPSSGRFVNASPPAINNDLLSYRPPAPQNAEKGSDWLLVIGINKRLDAIRKE